MIVANTNTVSAPAEPSPKTGNMMSITSHIERRAGLIKGVSIALIIVSLVVLIRALPMDRVIDLVESKADGLGLWGPFALGAAYVVAALAFFPGSALTLTAGAVFGLVWGTVMVSLASTTAAALAFLIARYLARDKVVRQARKFPKFQAIDRAIGEGGWKIIAMLRLSPAVPFSLGNYLFGLTAIRFLPYVLASWLFMLPGTFMYVYLGYIGAEGLRSAASAERGKTPGEWALLAVGLLATVAVTVYVTRLARRALRQQTSIEGKDMSNADSTRSSEQTAAGTTDRSRGAIALPFVAVAMLGVAASAHQRSDALRNLFGSAPATVHAAHQYKSEGPSFDHSEFDALLGKHVDADGWVDYAGLRKDVASLNSYIASVGNAPFAKLGRDEKLSLLINAYNAFTLRLILDHYPVKSIKNIPRAKRWADKRWRLGPMTLSLDQIEHEQIRPKFAEPRIHFALVCAAIGCPKLRSEAYQAERIEEQLEDQTRYVHSHDRWFRYQPGANDVRLTKLYDWYGSDFEKVAGSVLDFAARYSAQLETAIDKGTRTRIKWLDYDWTLNDAGNKR